MIKITQPDFDRLGFELIHTDDGADDYYYYKFFGDPYYGLRLTSCSFSESDLGQTWYVEFTDMGSMECIEDLELLEEFINVMNKIQNAPTEVTYRNRYNDRIIFEQVDDSIVMTIPPDASDFVRVGYYDNSPEDKPTNFNMIDPSGGPFIATKAFNGGFSATNMGNFHTSWEGLLVKNIEWIGPGKYKLVVDRNEN